MLLTLTACASDDQDLRDSLAAVQEVDEPAVTPAVPVEVSAELIDPEGTAVGTAWFRNDDGRAMVEVQVAGVTSGFHPMFLHDVGMCTAESATSDGPAEADPFRAAGEVLLDLPALLVLEDGVGSITTLAGSISLDQLLADDGTALLIGPAVDDLADIPSVPDEELPPQTTAGSQVACGAIGE